jgi:DNA polymerase III delta prime subunit
MFESLWIEKYRPSKLDQLVLSDNNRQILKKYQKTGEIPNLLFIGPAGIGKTSLARVICNDVLGCQYLYINASDENGIDTIRSKVTNFSRTKSFDGKIKCIILDETDGLSLDAQRALRNTMEEHSSITRFILTANYNHRIIPPLQSRCQSLDLTPDMKGCLERIDHIAKCESIEVTDQQKLHEFVKKCYPDLRKCINEIQKNTIDNKLCLDNLVKVKDVFVESLYEIINKGLAMKARKKIIENEHVFSGDYTELLRSLFNYIDSSSMNNNDKATWLLVVSEHIYRASFVMDPEINFYSCIIELSTKK